MIHVQGSGAELPMATWLMCLRFFVNCFRSGEMRTRVTTHCSAVLGACKGAAGVRNANVETAYASLILDFAVSIREVSCTLRLQCCSWRLHGRGWCEESECVSFAFQSDLELFREERKCTRGESSSCHCQSTRMRVSF